MENHKSMENDTASVQRQGENQSAPDTASGRVTPSNETQPPQHDLESSAAPNEDWGLEALEEDAN